MSKFDDPISEEVSVEDWIDEKGRAGCTIRSTKFKKSFIICKSAGGNSFFEIKNEVGMPAPIYGMFTDLRQAKEEVFKYIRQSKPSQAVRRDRMTARREKYRGTRVLEEPDS